MPQMLRYTEEYRNKSGYCYWCFAEKHKISLIPRTAPPTGQTVGNGIVVDVSKYFH
jgi:cell wall-associated NlpC family hydrolase